MNKIKSLSVVTLPENVGERVGSYVGSFSRWPAAASGLDIFLSRNTNVTLTSLYFKYQMLKDGAAYGKQLLEVKVKATLTWCVI